MAWVAVTASRVAADWNRARVREQTLRDRLSARWSRVPPEHVSETDQAMALTVADFLDELSEPQRQVVILRYYADLRASEIATALGIPEGTVKSRLHTAVEALRTRLRRTETFEL